MPDPVRVRDTRTGTVRSTRYPRDTDEVLKGEAAVDAYGRMLPTEPGDHVDQPKKPAAAGTAAAAKKEI